MLDILVLLTERKSILWNVRFGERRRRVDNVAARDILPRGLGTSARWISACTPYVAVVGRRRRFASRQNDRARFDPTQDLPPCIHTSFLCSTRVRVNPRSTQRWPVALGSRFTVLDPSSRIHYVTPNLLVVCLHATKSYVPKSNQAT